MVINTRPARRQENSRVSRLAVAAILIAPVATTMLWIWFLNLVFL